MISISSRRFPLYFWRRALGLLVTSLHMEVEELQMVTIQFWKKGRYRFDAGLRTKKCTSTNCDQPAFLLEQGEILSGGRTICLAKISYKERLKTIFNTLAASEITFKGEHTWRSSRIQVNDLSLIFYDAFVRIHAIWFIRNTAEFQLVLFLNFPQNLTSFVAYLLLNFLRILHSLFLRNMFYLRKIGFKFYCIRILH